MRCKEVDTTARINKADFILHWELVLLPGLEDDDLQPLLPGFEDNYLQQELDGPLGLEFDDYLQLELDWLLGFEFPERTLSGLVGQSATSTLCSDEVQGAYLQESRARELPPAVLGDGDRAAEVSHAGNVGDLVSRDPVDPQSRRGEESSKLDRPRSSLL